MVNFAIARWLPSGQLHTIKSSLDHASGLCSEHAPEYVIDRLLRNSTSPLEFPSAVVLRHAPSTLTKNTLWAISLTSNNADGKVANHRRVSLPIGRGPSITRSHAKKPFRYAVCSWDTRDANTGYSHTWWRAQSVCLPPPCDERENILSIKTYSRHLNDTEALVGDTRQGKEMAHHLSSDRPVRGHCGHGPCSIPGNDHRDKLQVLSGIQRGLQRRWST